MTQSQHELRDQIRVLLAQFVRLPVEQVDIARDFSDYGLGSAEAALFVGALEDALGRELSPLLVYDHPSVAALAAAIGEPRDL